MAFLRGRDETEKREREAKSRQGLKGGCHRHIPVTLLLGSHSARSLLPGTGTGEGQAL